jgi:hypothetical protein
MKKLVQIAVGAGVMFGAAPFLYETPLNHGAVFVPLFLVTMYGVAVVQHYWPRISSRRWRC